MIRRPAMVSMALALSASLLIAACGDDGDSDAADTTGSATTGAATTAATDTTAAADTTVELTGEPVKIMVFYEGTGAVATPEVPEGATPPPRRSTRWVASTARPSSSWSATSATTRTRPASAATKPCPTALSRWSVR